MSIYTVSEKTHQLKIVKIDRSS